MSSGDVFRGVLPGPDLAQVDAYPRRQLDAHLLGQLRQALVIGQGVANGVDRQLEEVEEAVGLVDRPAAVPVEQAAGELVVPLHDLGGPAVAGGGDLLRRGHQVAQQQSPDHGPRRFWPFVDAAEARLGRGLFRFRHPAGSLPYCSPVDAVRFAVTPRENARAAIHAGAFLEACSTASPVPRHARPPGRWPGRSRSETQVSYCCP